MLNAELLNAAVLSCQAVTPPESCAANTKSTENPIKSTYSEMGLSEIPCSKRQDRNITRCEWKKANEQLQDGLPSSLDLDEMIEFVSFQKPT